MNRVLVIDDFEPNLQLYIAVVKRAIGEEPLAYDEPLPALHWLRTHRPALVVVDYEMPEMNGIAFVREVRSMKQHANTPIIMLTAVNDFDVQAEALAAGTTLFIEKPLRLREFITQIRRFVSPPAPGDEDAQTAAGDRDTIIRLHRAMRARDPALAARARRTRDLAVTLAQELSVDAAGIEALRLASLVYDIGMIGVPEKVLSAASGLSAHWTGIVRDHVHTGATILGGAHSPLMNVAESIARYHHEHFDGSGYPEGRRGDAIPLLARVIAVADAFTAMTSERPYRIEMQAAQALQELRTGSGTRYDPAVIAVIERLKDRLTPARKSA